MRDDETADMMLGCLQELVALTKEQNKQIEALREEMEVLRRKQSQILDLVEVEP